MEEAKEQTVVAIAAKAVSEEYSAPWNMASMQEGARFMQELHEQTELVKLFDRAGIPIVILKGMAAAIYYPEPYLRTMGDIDLLVLRNQFDEAADLMKLSGYECTQEKGVNPRHMGFVKNDIPFELHHHFSSDGFDVDAILEDAIPMRKSAELNQCAFPVLPDMENGLVLLGHIQQHLRNSRLGLRQIVDWMMFVHAGLTDEAWNIQFRDLARKVGLELLAINITKMCKNRLGLPDQITWCDEGDDQLTEELLEILFESGNMGRKGVSSRGQAESMSLQIKRMGFFRWLYEYGGRVWPLSRKHRILRPLAMVYGIWKIAVKGIKAKREGTNIAEQMSKGNDRYEIYKKLGMNI